MEEESFPEKQLAASIASKVFYYLQEHDEALRLALEAGDRFDIMTENQVQEASTPVKLLKSTNAKHSPQVA